MAANHLLEYRHPVLLHTLSHILHRKIIRECATEVLHYNVLYTHALTNTVGVHVYTNRCCNGANIAVSPGCEVEDYLWAILF